MVRLHHEIEVADDCATLYLSGVLGAGDHAPLTAACDGLPAHVRTLRLDLHGIDEVDDAALVAVRAVLRYWRASRGGSFRLSLASERIVATYAEGRFTEGVLGLRDAPPHVVEAGPALTGMYL
jgi:ABC-type transporter Mla MlaB component